MSVVPAKGGVPTQFASGSSAFSRNTVHALDDGQAWWPYLDLYCSVKWIGSNTPRAQTRPTKATARLARLWIVIWHGLVAGRRGVSRGQQGSRNKTGPVQGNGRDKTVAGVGLWRGLQISHQAGGQCNLRPQASSDSGLMPEEGRESRQREKQHRQAAEVKHASWGKAASSGYGGNQACVAGDMVMWERRGKVAEAGEGGRGNLHGE